MLLFSFCSSRLGSVSPSPESRPSRLEGSAFNLSSVIVCSHSGGKRTLRPLKLGEEGKCDKTVPMHNVSDFSSDKLPKNSNAAQGIGLVTERLQDQIPELTM